MHHIDEHTIELYILGSELVKEQTAEIEAHLKECHGCHTIAEQMEAFYKNAENSLQTSSDYIKKGAQQSKALVRANKAVEQYYEPFSPPVRYRPITFVGKLAYFAKIHPVVTGVGSFATMATVAAVVLFGGKDYLKDSNPAYPFLNAATEKLEVYNKNHDLLWSIPSPEVINCSIEENETNAKTTIVTDLNSDEKNEVLTVVPSLGNEKDKRNVLRIFSPEKQLLKEISFGRTIKFRDRQYQSDFSSHALLVEDFGNTRNKEIIVSIRNNSSPSFISRLDNKGNEIGEYWHFGHIRGIYAVDVNGDGKKEITICASNDVEDDVHREYPVVIVLDPEKIINQTESVCTSGFNLPTSEAVLFYIRIPRTDIDNELLTSPVMRSLSTVDDQSLRFVSQSIPVKEYDPFQFDYIFSKDLRIVGVKSNNAVDQLHATLAQKGKLTGKIDQTYLDNLKHSVCYWDGKEWRKEWTMVKH